MLRVGILTARRTVVTRSTLYLNPDCARCRRMVMAKFFDRLGCIAVSTATGPAGPLRPGEIAVGDARTGELSRGVAAVRRIARQIPAYLPLLSLLYVPPVAQRIDREARGRSESCAASVPPAHAEVRS
jgi:hypothetical protein